MVKRPMQGILPFVFTLLATMATAVAAAPQPPKPGKPPLPMAPEAYMDPTRPLDERVAALLSQMTLAEKIGQMTQASHDALLVHPEDLRNLALGSILSGGGEGPTVNVKQAWADMVDGWVQISLQSRLGIPMLYGIDAVHGHNAVQGAVIYPHNIGLGATRDPELVRAIGHFTAMEVAATGIRWDFAPTVAVVQDIRWGRTYESYGEDTELVARLGRAYLEGLQNSGPERALDQVGTVLGTAKHFLGDGGTTWGTGTAENHQIDRGDTRVDEATLRRVFLPPYQALIAGGAASIMVSYSSWNGVKMSANKYLLTDVLKNELGFHGFLISDWKALDELPGTEREQIKAGVNAGLDMLMVPVAYRSFITNLTALVHSGEVSQARIDDAVSRILRVKFLLGLFEHPFAERALLPTIGAPAHRAVGRDAVAESAVLLKNRDDVLPLPDNLPQLLVAGTAADDLGAQCGGWTLTWQGGHGPITAGTTLLAAIKEAAADDTKILYSPTGEFKTPAATPGRPPAKARIGIAVVAEPPYAEYDGDAPVPLLTAADRAMINHLRDAAEKIIVVVYSGRPLVMTDVIAKADAVVAAFLPGSEGEGLADVLFGEEPFTGRLSVAWPRTGNAFYKPTRQKGDTLFPVGYGLSTDF